MDNRNLVGVYYGTVTDNKDPEKLGRVKVIIEAIDSEAETGWIPVMSLYATKNAGALFIPEIEDHVVIGFLGNSVHNAVVLGSVWSNQNAAAATGENSSADLNANGKNDIRVIKSRNENQIIMDDTKGNEKMQFILAGGRTRIVFDAADQSLTVEGENINIDVKQLMLILTQKFNMNFSGNLTLDSKLAVDVSQDKIDLKAGVKTDVKGATVLLN